MTAYYNEIDPFAAQWLRNLIDAGHIAPGEVDERSISDIRPSELVGYTQCHFFAGIGGWSLALRLGGWPDERPVWTGSCPCQPFSQAGRGGGTSDERHLWPHWFHLIRTLQPGVIFGEQVERAIGHGWLDLVQDDLEGEGYAVAPVVVPAAGVGAPHIRHRLWFVAQSDHERRNRQHSLLREDNHWGRSRHLKLPGVAKLATLGNGCDEGLEGREPLRCRSSQQPSWAGSVVGWVWCRDGKWRPVEPGTFPLADGVPARVGRLRAYGNAINPQTAAEVIRAYKECLPC